MSFSGTYKMTSTENFDEYMKALGVDLVTRKMAATATPTQEITQNGDEFQIKTMTTFKNTDIKFKLNEPFDETTADGRKVKTTVTKDGNKLIQSQKGDKDSVITREFKGNEMIMLLETAGIVCKRVYQKQ